MRLTAARITKQLVAYVTARLPKTEQSKPATAGFVESRSSLGQAASTFLTSTSPVHKRVIIQFQTTEERSSSIGILLNINDASHLPSLETLNYCFKNETVHMLCGLPNL
ncbi:hypothetical protein Mapa_000443 [Marchantia paleacea]|nr:hypothetical protein Mapa_000443 [Marchantia paleacea]